MPARIGSAALEGIAAVPIDVEVDVLAGLPSFTVVGLGDTAIKESKERLVAALTNAGFTPPRRKTIVSLAPASLKKEGSLYDVPTALAYLIASKQVDVSRERYEHAWFLGEVGLDGSIKPVRGVLPILLAAKEHGISSVYIPWGNRAEAQALADDIAIYPVRSLQALIDQLQGQELPAALTASSTPATEIDPEIDVADIQGHEHAKRALLIAAAGGHNVLLVGAPGSGKTLLARALAGILPPLTREEAYTVTSIYSIAGALSFENGLVRQRPFRSPHHGASSVALVGGGTHPRPGEVSLAHLGVLFLDELPEFSRHVLDQLRQPIEDGVVTISRASHTVKFPARSMLVGAMNPCKCGYSGSERRECRCSPGDVARYQRRVSGPLLDRFDVHVMVNDIPMEQLLADAPRGERSRDLAQRATTARRHQEARQGIHNAGLQAAAIKQHCQLNELCTKLLTGAQERFHISSRGVHRVLKVARTIADLEGANELAPAHIAEALQYREQLQQALPDFV